LASRWKALGEGREEIGRDPKSFDVSPEIERFALVEFPVEGQGPGGDEGEKKRGSTDLFEAL